MEKEKKVSCWKSYSFPIILIVFIILGGIIGIVYPKQALNLRPLGQIFINGMFTIVVPLVFFTISSAIANISTVERAGKIFGSLLFSFLGTGMIAAVIILTIVKIFPPATQGEIIKNLSNSVGNVETINYGQKIVETLTVEDFPQLLSKNSILPLIIFSFIFGLSVNIIGEKGKTIAKGLDALAEILVKMVNLLMYYAPIGLGAFFATTVAKYGPQLIGAYSRAMLIYYPLCIVYFLLMFPIYMTVAGGIDGLKSMKYLIQPALTSLATQSSIATLPVNLAAAKNIGVPKDIREVVLPIGATAHMDGTVFSSVLKISFLFGIYGYKFEGIETYLIAMIISIAGGVVMSGIPGGGFIGETLIVSLYGFPTEALAYITTIGYLVDPPATTINATGDTVAAMLVTRLVEGKDWIKRKLTENE